MFYYLYDSVGFVWGTFGSFADAYEEMERLEEAEGWTDLFITTDADPWSEWRKEHAIKLA